MDIIGEIKNVAIILTDVYRSTPQGMSLCQAGEEKFLRVIQIAKKPNTETLRIKIASCSDNIELASPGIEWNPENATLHIHWISGPTSPGKPANKSVLIASDGRVKG